jgi:hypothetical protein
MEHSNTVTSQAKRALSVIAITVAGFYLLFGSIVDSHAAGNPIYQAEFNAAGELIRPAGWREWIFVGSPLTPNSLNGGNAPFPEFHTVYKHSGTVKGIVTQSVKSMLVNVQK